MKKLFEYYNDILPEKNQWESVCSKPLPRCLWVNTLKISAKELKHYLEKEGCVLEPLVWNTNAFRTLNSDMGKCWEYSAGLFQIQEEVSMLPVHFLNPQPGERVLDLCAAPGSKTAQTAIRLNNQGTLIANDKSFQRMRAFGQISKRLGLINVSTTIHDGRTYPRLPDYFDKVLVDTPCSGEGVFRKGNTRDIPPNRKNSLRLQRIQIELLKKAITCCRPGGCIVYSTCTFAPEENEAVIDVIVREYSDIVVRPVQLDGFQLTPGVSEWRETIFDEAVRNTVRVWPHLNNTGGFFVAVLEKVGAVHWIPQSSRGTTERIGRQESNTKIEEQKARFGFPDTLFDRYVFSDNNHRGIYLINADNTPPDNLDIDATGLFFIKTAINYPKLSTAAAMLFGKQATKNKVELTKFQRDQYFQKEDFELEPTQIKQCSNTGYVICFYAGYPVGVGLYFEAREERPPILRSLFPKYLR